VNNCQSKLIVTTAELSPKVKAAKKRCPTLQFVVLIGDEMEQDDPDLSFSEMLKADPSCAKLLKGSEIDTTDYVAVLPYSSGTTVC